MSPQVLSLQKSSKHRSIKSIMASLFFLMLSASLNMAWSQLVVVDAVVNQKAIVSQGDTAYIKVSLKGLKPPREEERTPLNISMVIDRSGSMSGDRIKNAIEAVRLAVDQLEKDDIFSLIAYGSNAEVLIPATKVTNKKLIYKGIKQLRVNGNTALHAGVKLGADEVKKFFDQNRVNRVILLSDGIANVGPSSPKALGALGKLLGGQGMSVSTIGLGLGYNEDLMAQLASSSDGNHVFVEKPSELAAMIDNELGDALSVVAQNVNVEVTFPKGVTPIRALGRKMEIKDRVARASLNQIVGGNEKFLLIEAKIDPIEVGQRLQLASVKVEYNDTFAEKPMTLSRVAEVYGVKTEDEAEKTEVAEVMEDVVTLVATEKLKLAVSLKDKGDVAGAEREMSQSAIYLEDNAKRYKSKKLKKMEKDTRSDAKNIKKKGKAWRRLRKSMKRKSYAKESQMAY